MFLHLSVILFTGGACPLPACIHSPMQTPTQDADPLQSDADPLHPDADPPPPVCKLPSWMQTHSPWMQTHRPRCRPLPRYGQPSDVRIVLECILVLQIYGRRIQAFR